jgi:toxin ParE1/3/4
VTSGTRRRRTSKNEKTLTIRWTSRARTDLEAIGEYIARDDAEAAATWVARLMATVERLATLPFRGRCVPELARDDVREVLVRSYRIVYLVTSSSIDVLTIFEGHRLFPDDFDPSDGM